jgi:nucleoside-diphosphate-sugar epimerase
MKVCFIGSNGFMAKAFGKFYSPELIHVIGRTYPIYAVTAFTQTDLLKDKINIELLASFDIIFYFAGEGVQANNKTSAADIYKINTFLPIEIITNLNTIGYKGTVITFGSYAEIGSNSAYKPFTEQEILLSHLPVPNDYSVSKRLLSRFVDSCTINFKVLHFIMPTIYGKGENENRLIPYLIQCNKEGKKINLTSGHQIRHYLFVDDLPQIVHQAIKANIPHGIYNVAGPDILKVKDIVAIVANICHIPQENIEFNTMKRWDTGMNTLILDGQKLKNLINYTEYSKIETKIESYL